MKKTKADVIIEFISDLKELVAKIENNEESKQDYTKLQEYFELSNVPDKIISGCYEDCEFGSWIELYEEKHKKARDQKEHSINCAIGNIRGVASAIESQLLKYLSEND